MVQQISGNKYHIIGDIHGEYQALKNLISHLGYDSVGNHPDGYKIIFVGDLVDRGPDSEKVVLFIKQLVENNSAYVVMGNHELNILQGKEKLGNGWFFTNQQQHDTKYEPYNIVQTHIKPSILEFIQEMPLVLEGQGFNVVHACYEHQSIQAIRNIETKHILEFYHDIESKILTDMKHTGLLERYSADSAILKDHIYEQQQPVPYLPSIAEYNYYLQNNNPIKIITSGKEDYVKKPYYIGGKWRFLDRLKWWDFYNSDTDIIFGHYWRKYQSSCKNSMFNNIDYNSWHGYKNNVFCIDYSVGARFEERNHNLSLGTMTNLVALQLPDKILIDENGRETNTINYKK